MGGDRGGDAGAWIPLGKLHDVIYFLEEKLVRTSLEMQLDPPPALSGSDGDFFFIFNFACSRYLELSDRQRGCAG